MYTLIKTLLVAAVLAQPLAANAVYIDIVNDTGVSYAAPSHTFGDYIFELVDPAAPSFRLNDYPSPEEDFIVSNAIAAGDFRLRRLDMGTFDLLSLRLGGSGSSTIGGSVVALPGSRNFQDVSFAGLTGTTGVTSVLLSPATGSFIQISAFSVRQADGGGSGAVPVPATLLLMALPLIGMGWSSSRSRKSLSR